MANIPPLSPQGSPKSDLPKNPSDTTVNKTRRVSLSVFTHSFTQGLTQIKAIFTSSSGRSSPKLPSPSVANSVEDYETYLESLFLNPIIREISQEKLLEEAMGTATYEQLINQIITDLKRNDVIILNGKPLTLETSEEDNILGIKHQLTKASTNSEIVGLLQQGVHASLTTNPAQEQLNNFDLNISPLATTEEEQNLLRSDSLKKIELTVTENDAIALTVSEPIALVRIDEEGERTVIHYISVKGHYENGRIITTFTKIEPFEEIKEEEIER